MARPYWSGQIQISLVSFGVKLFPATEAKSEIRFHQLSRKTGERIKHQKISGDEGPVEKGDIVKGYEYRKGEYISIEPEEIENLRIPSRHNLVVSQFVGADELDPAFFEKPYFVVPEDDVQAEAFDYPPTFFEKRLWRVPRPRCDSELLQKAASWIRLAKQPLIIAGGGTIYQLCCNGIALVYTATVAGTGACT